MFSNDCNEENIKCKIFCHFREPVREPVRGKKYSNRIHFLNYSEIYPVILQMLLVVKKKHLASLSVHKKIRIMITETSLNSHNMQEVRLTYNLAHDCTYVLRVSRCQTARWGLHPVSDWDNFTRGSKRNWERGVWFGERLTETPEGTWGFKPRGWQRWR